MSSDRATCKHCGWVIVIHSELERRQELLKQEMSQHLLDYHPEAFQRLVDKLKAKTE